MADDRFKILEERLSRLEATLSQRAAGGGTGGFTPPGGVITDPAPWAGGFQFMARPSPVVDPPPWWGGMWGRPRWPTPVVDPAPFPMPVVDPAPWPTPVVDPAPWGGQFFAQPPTATAAARFGRIGPIGDPPPPDIGRLAVSQLEAALHSISAEKTRLDAMETMIKKQLETAKKQQQPG